MSSTQNHPDLSTGSALLKANNVKFKIFQLLMHIPSVAEIQLMFQSIKENMFVSLVDCWLEYLIYKRQDPYLYPGPISQITVILPTSKFALVQHTFNYQRL